ncbi:hypothetical protein GCM10027053_12640 [Intrasporangium mesophilum]
MEPLVEVPGEHLVNDIPSTVRAKEVDDIGGAEDLEAFGEHMHERDAHHVEVTE